MIRVFAACGMGVGTSTILKTRLRSALDATGVEYTLDVTDVGAAKSQQADIIFTSAEFAEDLQGLPARIVIINNFMDREEVRSKVEEVVASIE